MSHSISKSLTDVTASCFGPLKGQFDAPGDKSVSHRSLIMGALARGNTRINGLLESDDVLNTAKAVQALGAEVAHKEDGSWHVQGTGGAFKVSDQELDLGNSGTGVRLMMGAVAGTGISARFVGDESLSSRPMARVTDPLSQMGAIFETANGQLPVTLAGGTLKAVDYTPPIASAQVKSAILLAGLGATGKTIVREKQATRDHTERMLAAFGVDLEVTYDQGSLTASLEGPQSLTACDIDVPGDPSSVSFAIVAALLTPASSIHINRVMDNPARTGLLTTLKDMGADLTLTSGPDMAGEKTFNISARYSRLKGIDVPAERAPSMIDEYPVLGVAAACASGTTRMLGLAELKAKESDRLTGTADMLKANGVRVETSEDSLTVHGCGEDRPPGGGRVETRHDHRLAMSGLVLGLVAQKPVTIDSADMIATSYPDFFDHMRALGAQIDQG